MSIFHLNEKFEILKYHNVIALEHRCDYRRCDLWQHKKIHKCYTVCLLLYISVHITDLLSYRYKRKQTLLLFFFFTRTSFWRKVSYYIYRCVEVTCFKSTKATKFNRLLILFNTKCKHIIMDMMISPMWHWILAKSQPKC